MKKKELVALADAIKRANSTLSSPTNRFSTLQIELLADFCQSQNPAFKRERWLSYIAGECGKNGGTR